jgi:hypothetical protein
MYRVGKARKRFLARSGHGREPASCAGGRENSLALQAPGVTRLCRESERIYAMKWRIVVTNAFLEFYCKERREGKKKRSERASEQGGVAAAVAGEEKNRWPRALCPLAKDHLYREFLTLDNSHAVDPCLSLMGDLHPCCPLTTRQVAVASEVNVSVEVASLSLRLPQSASSCSLQTLSSK